MKRMSRYFPLIAGLSVAFTLAAAAGVRGDDGAVRADRTPLTFRDGGLYTNVNMVHGSNTPEEDGITNLLPFERAASPESPWSFYILQHPLSVTSPPSPEEAEMIRQLAAGGKRVILYIRTIGRLGTAPSVDELERRLVESLEGIDPDWIYAITLGEEHGYWGGWGEALAELYHRAKQRWPDLPVYQWWTPMHVPNVRAASGYTALPADGWVIDLYGMHRQRFEQKVVKALETGKPLIHIVWSSPTWVGSYQGAPSWEEGGRRVFDEQLEVCRAYNVPVAHFCLQPSANEGGARLHGYRYGWQSPLPELREWYRQLEVLAANNRLLPDAAIGFRPLTEEVFDWAHAMLGHGDDVYYRLDAMSRRQMTFNCHLDMPLEPGEHPLGLPEEAAKYFNVTSILDESAADLRPGIGVAGIAGRYATATLVFRIEPERPVSGLEVTVDLEAVGALGGSAKVSFSDSGVEWSEPVTTDKEKRRSSFTLTRRAAVGMTRFSQAPWWIRVQLHASSATATRDNAARVHNLTVKAAVEPRLN